MELTDFEIGSVKVNGLKNVNILIGRNGAGKSRFLRVIDEAGARDPRFNVSYISPERAGVFQRDGSIMTTTEKDPSWLKAVRRKNQAENFKAASANRLRDIETAYLRKLQDTPAIRQDTTRSFRTDRLEAINVLLGNVSIVQQGSDFEFHHSNGEIVKPSEISSGESEAVALATEFMYFFDNLRVDRFNILLLDEPDVHLHADLQARLARFLIGLVEDLDDEMKPKVAVILATHSTPLVCALSSSDRVAIGTKEFRSDAVTYAPVSPQLKKVAPFFGHPLSLSLSNDVMLILEGEDDERIWQQAVRTSQGRIKLFPVLAQTVDQQTQLESFCATLLGSLYDEPLAYSLRDGDGVAGDLPAVGPVVRYRLQCYSVENLLLTDQALAMLGGAWDKFKAAAETWLASNEGHKDATLLRDLIASGDRLRNTKIKSIRQLICAILGSTKPWEIVVGQAIGSLDLGALTTGPFDIATFVGPEAIRTLLDTGAEG